jgi:hypothetical protein
MEDSTTTNVQLMNLAKKMGLPLNAVVYKDLLDNEPFEDGAYILNMASSTDSNGGTHWIGLYVKYPDAYYFDSFGVVPPLEIIKYCKDNGIKKIIVSDKQIQRSQYGRCGQYTLAFLYAMHKGRGPYLKRYQKFLNEYNIED